MYQPTPINTENIELPKDLQELTELIAENVHDNWARGRIEEGWTLGREKNQQLKTTPLLVPYQELPESEKEYDRITALETIKTIIRLGYEIRKK